MALSNYDYTKLLDSLKLISRAIHVVAKETNDMNRHEAELLASDIVDRFYNDIKEMKEGFKPVEHGGSINELLKEKNKNE